LIRTNILKISLESLFEKGYQVKEVYVSVWFINKSKKNKQGQILDAKKTALGIQLKYPDKDK